MKTISPSVSRQLPLRGLCMTVAAVLFALSVAELVLKPGNHIALWRGLALSSLYLALCLAQRRLFAPRSKARGRVISW